MQGAEDVRTEEEAEDEEVFVPSSGSVVLHGLLHKHRRRKNSDPDTLDKSKVGLVITHPHPKLGGNMYNNVVTALYDRFSQQGYCVLCFDFRGTGKSTGGYTWRGGGERDDIIAMVKYLQERCQVDVVFTVGYSYGSAIACSVINELDIVRGAVAISYPFGVLTFILLGRLLPIAKTRKDCLWVIGDNDNFTSEARFRTRVAELCLDGVSDQSQALLKKKKSQNKKHKNKKEGKEKAEEEEEEEEGQMTTPKQCMVVVPNIDHFWFGKEALLASIILQWLEQRLAVWYKETRDSKIKENENVDEPEQNKL
jgi:alpha/beta superfamily hydrolase